MCHRRPWLLLAHRLGSALVGGRCGRNRMDGRGGHMDNVTMDGPRMGNREFLAVSGSALPPLTCPFPGSPNGVRTRVYTLRARLRVALIRLRARSGCLV